MSQIYLNGPSVGRAISAEEFAAGAGQCPGAQPCSPPDNDCGCGCGCANACCSDDCGQTGQCCQQMICCCRPAPAPTPHPPQVEEGCCCKQSFRAALGLLCDQQISNLLNFDEAAFITNTYTAGAVVSSGGKPHSAAGNPTTQVEDDPSEGASPSAETESRPNPPTPPCPGGQSDNLGDLEGSFLRFTPCTCDLLDIDAELYTAGEKDCSFTATQVSLCELDAVVIQGASGCAEGSMDASEVAARNFRCLRQRLAQRLNPCADPCGENWCSCACESRDCCCAAGLLSILARNNLSRRVSLAAGLLVLQNVTLLGTVGNVLVLANDTDQRLYFVCVNSVQFIG